MVRQPETLKHTFSNQILQNHFKKTPPPAGACRLIDLDPDVFLDTEEELNVIGATLWVMAVIYDKMDEKDTPKNREELRKWIIITRNEVLPRMLGKVEPPFTFYSIDQMQRDIGGMMEELLLKTLPPIDKKVDLKK
ncbi:hypothetical protein BD324DRAFT_94606 [Kockovaella imperatae]|uniref:Uncharacterized protein n=1 Tax=Kockovaella imperatae TaxID=4999 RepID=A0A1Y1UBJ7_9TREE|nr:hypothetical protein BD324DRAFT_94606 [Kockovaella imperatae]ORX35389.1 hypothetical protein BD324DRAFT_94606 [Kockovaella imperatae]